MKKGKEHRAYLKLTDENCLKMENLKLSGDKQTKMTKFDEEINKYGHKGQGESLNERKLVGNKK